MRSEQQKADLKLGASSRGGFIPLQDIMDVRAAAVHNSNNNNKRNGTTAPITQQGKRILDQYPYRRSFSQGHGKRIFSASYFSVESLLLLVCLTASLLLLPLILPPLPPPPFMLLLLPICIFGLLMLLAFMPSSSNNVRDAANYTYL